MRAWLREWNLVLAILLALIVLGLWGHWHPAPWSPVGQDRAHQRSQMTQINQRLGRDVVAVGGR